MRFHDLRHTYGSLLVAGGIDLASVKAAMGHARLSTTERYLHARSATDLADNSPRHSNQDRRHDPDGTTCFSPDSLRGEDTSVNLHSK